MTTLGEFLTTNEDSVLVRLQMWADRDLDEHVKHIKLSVKYAVPPGYPANLVQPRVIQNFDRSMCEEVVESIEQIITTKLATDSPNGQFRIVATAITTRERRKQHKYPDLNVTCTVTSRDQVAQGLDRDLLIRLNHQQDSRIRMLEQQVSGLATSAFEVIAQMSEHQASLATARAAGTVAADTQSSVFQMIMLGGFVLAWPGLRDSMGLPEGLGFMDGMKVLGLQVQSAFRSDQDTANLPATARTMAGIPLPQGASPATELPKGMVAHDDEHATADTDVSGGPGIEGALDVLGELSPDDLLKLIQKLPDDERIPEQFRIVAKAMLNGGNNAQ